MCLWLQDFTFDYHEINRWTNELPLLGVKGTTGTTAPATIPALPDIPVTE